MKRNILAAVVAVGFAAGGTAAAAVTATQQQQQPNSPAVQMPQTMAGPAVGQMPMGAMTPMMNDPRMQAQMNEMMDGCHRMMSRMEPMPRPADGRR